MRNVLLISMIIFYASSIVISSEDKSGLSNEKSSVFMQELANVLTNKAPIDIIIALDSSASMNNSSIESQKIALNFLRLIEKEKKDNVRIGYVSWSHITKIFEPPTPNYSLIENLINRTIFSGNTCFVTGINKSVELLNANTSINHEKALVFISDGFEYCNRTETVFNCSNLEWFRDSQVSFYAISPLGNKSEMFQCPEYFSKQVPYKPADSKDTAILSNKPSKNSIVLQASGREILLRELKTNITVTKIVEGGDAGPRIVLRITAPPVEDINNAIVLALDSSGSFGLGGRPDHGIIVRKAVSNVLDDVNKSYPKTNISVLSWDDDIDFAYFDLMNRNPSKAKMVPIAQAVDEFSNNYVFIPSEKYLLPFNLWENMGYTDKFFYCRENEATNLTVGIQGAIDVLDANYPKKKGDVEEIIGKSIVLITDKSEFTDYRPEVVYEAKEKGYKIYPVGLGVIDGSLLKESLERIAKSSNGSYQYSPTSSVWTEDAVRKNILGAVENTLNGKVIDGIKINESLYPYLNVVNINVKLNGTTINSPFSNNPLKSINGNSWDIRLKDGIKAGDTLEIFLETEFKMQLPVDVTANITKADFTPETGTTPSSITFNWRGIKEFYIPLPENSINI